MPDWHDTGGPAFPTDHSKDSSYTDVKGGMSLRDYFAAAALPTIMLRADQQNTLAWSEWCVRCATSAYEVADAMIAERAK